MFEAEWWAEYTRVPPVNRVDFSRRKVVAYYYDPSCSSCGLCAPSAILSIDSPTGARKHTIVRKPLVSLLAV